MSQSKTEPDSPLIVAHSIANTICENAIWSDNQCCFHGAIAPENISAPPRFSTLSGDLYEGSAGIARYLFMIDRYSNQNSYLSTACAALRHALASSEGYSLFTGRLGVGLVALECDRQEFANVGIEAVDRCLAEALEDSKPAADMLAGLAGVIAGLIAAWRRCSLTHWRDGAITLGQRLIDMAETSDDTLSWPLYPGSSKHICGMAHGASGVAYAMELLASLAPGECNWRRVARGARNFERRHYSCEHGSWADLRDDIKTSDEGSVYPHLWCHGSIGIASERLSAIDPLGTADRIAALDAIKSFVGRLITGPRGAGAGDAMNGSICHGLSGVVELLIDTALLSASPEEWLELARRVTAAMRDDAQRPAGWRCGVPGGWPCPGLMLGLAGIGWAHLRLHAPNDIDSAWRPVPVNVDIAQQLGERLD